MGPIGSSPLPTNKDPRDDAILVCRGCADVIRLFPKEQRDYPHPDTTFKVVVPSSKAAICSSGANFCLEAACKSRSPCPTWRLACHWFWSHGGHSGTAWDRGSRTSQSAVAGMRLEAMLGVLKLEKRVPKPTLLLPHLLPTLTNALLNLCRQTSCSWKSRSPGGARRSRSAGDTWENWAQGSGR